ncbi:hypothetical protein Tco_0517237 [Tanacetum coccineum]
MFVPASPEHVPTIPDQLPVEPLLAPNPPELDNDYLDAVDYDDKEEPYEDLDDEEEDPEENPEMDLDEEEEDLEMDVDDEEEEEPLLVSPPPLSPLRTSPLVFESSSDSNIPVSTTTTVGRPYKGPLSTYEVGGPSSVASTSVFSATYELNVDAAERTVAATKAAEVARAAATAETTRAAATVGGARGSNNTGPAVGAGGPNVAGPTVGAVAMNAVLEVRGCSYTEFMNKCAENDKVKYVTSILLDEALSWWNSVAQPIGI